MKVSIGLDLVQVSCLCGLLNCPAVLLICGLFSA